MLKIIAIGDVHADWAKLWAALRAAYVADQSNQPSSAVLTGRYQVILMGDLVHPKDEHVYEDLTGRIPFDFDNPDHLRAAARAQVRDLYKFKKFQEAAGGNVTVLLGNHDQNALDHKHQLGTATGITHNEFNPKHGGVALPDDLAAWIQSWPTSQVIEGLHFSHAGPTPGMASFDDFFYGDSDSKNWWRNKGWMVKAAGYRFGVYGHTMMPEGIFVNQREGYAMIDALDRRQYLEILLDDEGEFNYTVCTF
jgi:hypothetical protein